MKRLREILLVFLTASVVMFAGCAVKGSLLEDRTGEVITFTQVDSGRSVSLSVGGGYAYEKRVDREFMGVNFKGYLFKAEDGSSVLVSRLPRDVFENLIGRQIKAPATGVTAYSPKTVFLPRFCQLVRAYVITLDSDVVAAVKILSFADDAGGCDRWETSEAFLAENFDAVAEFDNKADAAIVIH